MVTPVSTQTRHAVFETNSSSSHSLTLSDRDIPECALPEQVIRNGYVLVSLGEFGWGPDDLYSFEDKLSYLLTEITGGNATEYHRDYDQIGLYQDRGFDTEVSVCLARADALISGHRLEPIVRMLEDYLGIRIGLLYSSGYIDHQSVGMITNDLSDSTQAEILAMFLNGQNYITISNDNDY